MRSRRPTVIENLALRQRLATLAGRRHPDIWPADRVFWVLLRRYWSRWAEALAIVQPDTVVGWHRAGFRIYWNWLSRRGKRSGRPPLPREARALIRRMATENPWGTPRIQGEPLRLGFDASERSVSRHLRSLPRTPRASATWTTFLRSHRDGIAAMDSRHGRADGDDPVDPHGTSAHQLSKPLAHWNRGEICWNPPPRTSRPRHRPERTPSATPDRIVRHAIQRGQDAHRTHSGSTNSHPSTTREGTLSPALPCHGSGPRRLAQMGVRTFRAASLPSQPGRTFKPSFGSGDRSYEIWLPWPRMI
jgi:hypothetical protein